jgi:hypothetical protein
MDKLRQPSTAQASPKRVRQSSARAQFGCWWDLRYPTRSK